MSKIFIGLTTSSGHGDLFDWYNIASKYVDGLAVVFHKDKNNINDAGYNILSKNIKEGFIEEIPYYGNHSHSMNHFLLNPIIRPGDWIILRDSTEKLTESFLKQLNSFKYFLENNNINSVYQYSKMLMFTKQEGQFFIGTPHWGLYGAAEKAIAIENLSGFIKEEDYAYSVRNSIRPKDHFIAHFLKYYLMDGSNHLLLGRENDKDSFLKQETIRRQFKKYIETELNLNNDSFKDFLLENKLNIPEKLKEFINSEPILNNFFHYYILNVSLEEIINNGSYKIYKTI